MVLFVYQQMTRLLCQSFVSDQLELLQSKFEEEHIDASMANFVCFVAVSFKDWIHSLQDSDDNWLKICALFIVVSLDFLTFVESYILPLW